MATWTMAPPETVEMQERLDMLMRIWNVEAGDSHFEVRYLGEYDEHHWKIAREFEYGGDEEDDEDDETTSRETGLMKWEHYTGVTIAEAVAVAWEHEGRPVHCVVCEGKGELVAKSWEIENAALIGDKLATKISIDAEGNRADIPMVLCFGCAGEGYKLGGES